MTKLGPVWYMVWSWIARVVLDSMVPHSMLFYVIWDHRSHILNELSPVLHKTVPYCKKRLGRGPSRSCDMGLVGPGLHCNMGYFRP
jgi:hypothetical protein